MQSRNKTMEETMLHRTTARRERRAAIRRRRILCSNEHSKLCFRPTGSILSDENHLPDLTVGEFPPKSDNTDEKKGTTKKIKRVCRKKKEKKKSEIPEEKKDGP